MTSYSSGRDALVGPALLRLARPDDLDGLVALENASFAGDRLSRRSLRRLIGVRSAVVLVAEAVGGLAGAAVLLLRSYSSRARLYSLAVAATAKGKGVGSGLLATAEAAARERGALWLTLEVREDNRTAIAFYAGRNFGLVGRTEGYYSDGGAALHYRKALGNGA